MKEEEEESHHLHAVAYHCRAAGIGIGMLFMRKSVRGTVFKLKEESI